MRIKDTTGYNYKSANCVDGAKEMKGCHSLNVFYCLCMIPVSHYSNNSNRHVNTKIKVPNYDELLGA